MRLKDEQELEKCQGGEYVGEHCTPGDGAASRKSRPLVRAADVKSVKGKTAMRPRAWLAPQAEPCGLQGGGWVFGQ